jgi:predicted nuclease of predicted toxin-antitoxin system
LLDEHVTPSLAGAVYALEPSIVVDAVGQPNAPPKRTSDPELLDYAAQVGALVVTLDTSTMVQFAIDRIRAGVPMAGLLVIPSDQSSRRKVAEDMLLIWSITTPEEWHNRIEYLPL